MKAILSALCFFPLLVGAQINVRIGTDTFYNSFWNSWKTRGIANDSSGTFHDIAGRQTKVRAVIGTPVTMFDNGAGYLAAQTMIPDTALRRGIYYTGTFAFSLIGLDTSFRYRVTFFASRLKADTQYTVFAHGKDSVKIVASNNRSQAAVFDSLTTADGRLVFSINKKQTYDYLNAFRVEATPKIPPVKARIVPDSTAINYPNSVIHLADSSTGPVLFKQWSQLSGPSRLIFTSDTAAGVFASGMIPGTYRVQLLVEDSLMNIDSASISLTLSPFTCPICPVITCPVCPVCPPARTATGYSWVMDGDKWVLKFTYSDGNP